tara:strand:- start:1081 stop:1365 length:285 start_codon:yes stop_codon:yes gene_type:complete
MSIFLLLTLLIIFFFISTKLFLSSYIKNPLKYIYLQVRYFTIKLIVSSCFVVLFCRYNEDLKLIAIISSLAVFIVCHFIEGFIVQKKIINNVEK